MNDRKMHKGPPPHVGWWCVKRLDRLSRWRWWDGCHWSLATWSYWNEETVGLFAERRSDIDCSYVAWCHYWPKNARVKRIDPRKL